MVKMKISILIAFFIIFLAGCITGKPDDKYENIDEIFKKAIETKNETICDKTIDFSNRCYNQLARITKNPDFCKPIHKNEPTKSTCHYAPGTFTPEYCTIYTKYGGYDEDYGACVAEASSYDIRMCTQLNDKTQKRLCLTVIYLKNDDLTDKKACLLQTDESIQEMCKLKVMNNICNINQSACSAQQCLDLEFSLKSDLDLCKQTTVRNKCKNDKETCSVELCKELNLSNQESLERCKDAVVRIITKNKFPE